MSIETQIQRLQQAKSSLRTAIQNKGVTVPTNAKIDTYDDYVAQISSISVESKSITSNGTYTAPSGKAYSPVIVNVPSGGGKAKQVNSTIKKITNSTSYITCDCSITVEKTGTYKCTWVNWAYAAGSSSTYATQLYVAGSAKGSVHSSPVYSNATGSNFVCVENNIALTAGQVVDVRARTRSGSSYYTTAGFLVIEEV